MDPYELNDVIENYIRSKLTIRAFHHELFTNDTVIQLILDGDVIAETVLEPRDT